MLTCRQPKKIMQMSTYEIFHDVYRHVFPIKWYSEIPEKQQNHVNFSILQRFADHLSYYGRNVRSTTGFILYPGSFFVLWILMNKSFQSPHPEVCRVSLLCDSASEQLTVFVQNFKSYSMSTCPWHVRIFLPICGHEKMISMTAVAVRERLENLQLQHCMVAPAEVTAALSLCPCQRASWTYPPQVFTSVHLFNKIIRSGFTINSPLFQNNWVKIHHRKCKVGWRFTKLIFFLGQGSL